MRIKVLFNTAKEWARELASDVREFLFSDGFEVVERGADATICIGGDGTILHYNFVGRLEGAVLGIGSRTSYVCQLKRETWKMHITNMLKKGKTEKRLLLNAVVGTKTYTIMNDAVIHTTNYRVAEIEVSIDDRLHSFAGDGVIVSTPTGSSSYSYSAGARILRQCEKKLVIAPICAYLRRFQSMIINDGAKIKIRSNDPVALIIDGIFVKNIQKKTVSIRRGDTWLYLLSK